MNNSPLNGVFDFLIMALGLNRNLQSREIIEISPINLPPQYQAPPNLFPNGQDTFLPPFNPIGPYNPNPGSGGAPQNPNEVPQEISDLLSGR